MPLKVPRTALCEKHPRPAWPACTKPMPRRVLKQGSKPVEIRVFPVHMWNSREWFHPGKRSQIRSIFERATQIQPHTPYSTLLPPAQAGELIRFADSNFARPKSAL